MKKLSIEKIINLLINAANKKNHKDDLTPRERSIICGMITSLTQGSEGIAKLQKEAVKLDIIIDSNKENKK